MDDDDVWGDSDDVWDGEAALGGYAKEELDREYNTQRDKFVNEGYREALDEGKQETIQEGFDIGYREGIASGATFGMTKGALAALSALAGQAPGTSGIRREIADLESGWKDAEQKNRVVLCQEILDTPPKERCSVPAFVEALKGIRKEHRAEELDALAAALGDMPSPSAVHAQLGSVRSQLTEWGYQAPNDNVRVVGAVSLVEPTAACEEAKSGENPS